MLFCAGQREPCPSVASGLVFTQAAERGCVAPFRWSWLVLNVPLFRLPDTLTHEGSVALYARKGTSPEKQGPVVERLWHCL